MYIFKNAMKNVTIAKGRSLLILILVFVIALSACVALSIRSSAENAKETTLANMSITAQITANRENIMNSMGQMDRDAMESMLGNTLKGFDLEQLSTYAQSEYVDNFYYTASLGLNSSTLTAYSSTQETSGFGGMSGGMGGMSGMSGMMGTSGDFSVTAYSSHDAMASFISGETVIVEGEVFSVEDNTNTCVISQELAVLNDLYVGDVIEFYNPNNEADLVEMTISGIFFSETSDQYADSIYISYPSAQSIVDASQALGATYTDERTGTERSSGLSIMPNASYVFADVTSYESFVASAEEIGIDTESYMITSSDLQAYEESLLPLDNLSNFTLIFFMVVLAIGAVILIVFNLFSVRERKYEIGVLAAIGMPKGKVAMQFISEVMIVTFVAILLGAGVGTFVSQPIGDVLLESQVTSIEDGANQINDNFGGGFSGRQPSGMQGGDMFGGMFGGSNVEYIETLQTSTDFMVLFQLLGVGLLLAIIASSVAIISILRYEPLKILSNRA